MVSGTGSEEEKRNCTPRPDPFAHFTARVRSFRASGTATAELSYYPAVGDLLGDDANGLSVVAMPHPSAEQGRSADLGLFAKHQLAQGAIVGGEAWERQMLEHGVVEVKPPGEDIETTVASDQVLRYTRHYGKTIVTNLRDWRTVTLLPDGRTVTVDGGITLATDEASFWALTAGDASKALVTPQALLDYLRGAIQDGAPVTSAKALAKILATHARRALHNVETSGSTALDPLRQDLEQTLGVTFSDDRAGTPRPARWQRPRRRAVSAPTSGDRSPPASQDVGSSRGSLFPSSSSWGRCVSLPETLSAKDLSSWMPSSCRSRFWSRLLTRVYPTRCPVMAASSPDVSG